MSEKSKNRLKELRLSHDYTLDDIERLTGIKRGTYNNYENGNTEPKLETWQKLADFWDVTVPYLQGLTISESDVLRIINDSYLSDVQQFLASQNESKSFDYASFIKSDDIYFGVSRSVDMYLLINKIPLPLNSFSMLQLKKYSKDVEAYWKKNFDLSAYALKEDVPEKMSDLENDSGFITEEQAETDYVKTSTFEELVKRVETLEGSGT